VIGENAPGQGAEAEEEVHREPEGQHVLELHAQGEGQRDGERGEGDLVEMEEEVRRHGEQEDFLFVVHRLSAAPGNGSLTAPYGSGPEKARRKSGKFASQGPVRRV